MRISHIGICVSDWKRSLRFYHDVLGFRYVHELEVKGEPSDTLLRLDGRLAARDLPGARGRAHRAAPLRLRPAARETASRGR